MLKALVIILLTLGIFGGAYYATYVLYLKPIQAIREEKAAPPLPPPPDPTLPEFERVKALQEQGDIMAERSALQDFIARYPQSSKGDEAKERLGQINISLYLSPVESPDKTVYIVKPNDVITRVANRLQSTPELVMRSNNLTETMLRIGQKLVVPPSNFSLEIKRKERKVVVLQNDRFFKQYNITTTPAAHAAEKKGAPKEPKKTGKVTDKMGWDGTNRITINDKKYLQGDFWIMISPGGNNLYTDLSADANSAPHKPPGGGHGLSADDMRELAVLVRKNDEVTIE